MARTSRSTKRLNALMEFGILDTFWMMIKKFMNGLEICCHDSLRVMKTEGLTLCTHVVSMLIGIHITELTVVFAEKNV